MRSELELLGLKFRLVLKPHGVKLLVLNSIVRNGRVDVALRLLRVLLRRSSIKRNVKEASVSMPTNLLTIYIAHGAPNNPNKVVHLRAVRDQQSWRRGSEALFLFVAS